MTKEQKIIELLLEKADQFEWKERQIESGIGQVFSTRIGGEVVAINRYDSKIFIGKVYIGESPALEDKVVKIISESRQKERDKILNPVLDFLDSNDPYENDSRIVRNLIAQGR